MTGYTIISAAYADEENGSAIIETVEAGSVAISPRDRPELWVQMMRSHTPAAYVPPPPPPPPKGVLGQTFPQPVPPVPGQPSFISQQPTSAPAESLATQTKIALLEQEIAQMRETQNALIRSLHAVNVKPVPAEPPT